MKFRWVFLGLAVFIGFCAIGSYLDNFWIAALAIPSYILIAIVAWLSEGKKRATRK